MTKKITYAKLFKLGACEAQLDLFKELFPNGAEITLELCVKHAADFNWTWAAARLLSLGQRAEYDRACGTALAEWDRACGTALAEWDRSLAEYDRARATAWAEYSRACATAFATAYLSSGH